MDFADDYSWESQKMWHITRLPFPPVLISDTAWAQIAGVGIHVGILEPLQLTLPYN